MGKVRDIGKEKMCISSEYLQQICMKYKKKPYLINGIIWNSSILASIGKNGQIYRLWWPNIDIPQHIDDMKVGIFILGKTKHTIWLEDSKEQWAYNQYYEKDTNILVSEARNKILNVFVKTINFAVPNKDLLVRHFTIINLGNEKIELEFIHYSALSIEENPLYNMTTFIKEEDSLIHYRHNYAFCISSPIKCSGYSTKNAYQDAKNGKLNGGGSILNTQGAISYSISIRPNEMQEISIYFTCGNFLEDAIDKMKEAKSKDFYKWFKEAKNEDFKFLQKSKPILLEDKEIENLYKRSLLVEKILFDKRSGSIIAAPEVDETYSRSGGYNYCWGRDGVYVARSLQMAGFYDFTREFYLWTITSQNKDGSWQQRHYHDGKLAPSWGFQVDEGGIILWGIWEFYKETKDNNFLEQIWETIKKGADFLIHYIDKKNNLPQKSIDLWEERRGQHVYSCASVYGGLIGAYSIAKKLGYEELGEEWKNTAEKIKEAINKSFWSKRRQRYYRTINEEVSKEIYKIEKRRGNMTYKEVDEKGYISYYIGYDEIIDTSLLGLVEPFEVFSSWDDKLKITANLIEEKLWNRKVGGLKRYENDEYLGGNPWIITTLWLALFRINQKQYTKAKNLLYWVVEHKTCLGLLSEQIDKYKGTPAWVIPLNWSHAMFILTVQRLKETNQI